MSTLVHTVRAVLTEAWLGGVKVEAGIFERHGGFGPVSGTFFAVLQGDGEDIVTFLEGVGSDHEAIADLAFDRVSYAVQFQADPLNDDRRSRCLYGLRHDLRHLAPPKVALNPVYPRIRRVG